MAGSNSFKETVESLFHGMDSVITSKTVVGEAIHINGTIILPLMECFFWNWCRFVQCRRKKKKEWVELVAKMTPSAVIVIQDGKTKLVNIKNQDTVTKLLDMVPDVIDRFTSKDEKLSEDDVADILDSADESSHR